MVNEHEYSLKPKENTRLYDVDLALEGYPASVSACRGLTFSLDHLHLLAKVIGDLGAQFTNSPFTLIRASLEVNGSSMWVLGAGSRKEMITRQLIMEKQNSYDRLQAYANADASRKQREKEVFKKQDLRFQELARNAPDVSVRAVKEGRFSSYTALREGSRAFDLYPSMLTGWQGASGVAHGRSWGIISTTDMIEIPGTRDAKGAQFQLTSNTETLASMLFLAVVAHDALWRFLKDCSQGVRRRRNLYRLESVEAINLDID